MELTTPEFLNYSEIKASNTSLGNDGHSIKLTVCTNYCRTVLYPYTYTMRDIFEVLKAAKASTATTSNLPLTA